MFFKKYRNVKNYRELTAFATAYAILQTAKKRDYRATIYLDGVREEAQSLRKTLRKLYLNIREVKHVRNEESNSFIRLSDSLCGLIRDGEDENKQWSITTLKKLIEQRKLIEIK